ncbi:MAG: efflux RND transporter periplasmic adaptor subunit [Verrucomicrobiales bacterium]|nr:efflux RND transporter periplasmic adaptor subunit [Verrucomicrobiales bacterium]
MTANVTLRILAAMGLLSLAVILAGCRPRAASSGGGDHDHAAHAHAHEGTEASPVEDGAMCVEHGVPEAECAVCNPDLIGKLEPGESLKVRLPSTNSTALVGVRTALPESGSVAEAVDCLAEVCFNQNKLARIAAPVGGLLQSIAVDLGTRVDEADTVARIWSASIAEAVARAVLSHQTLERERRLRADRVTSQAALEEAEATHRAACQQLRTLGFTEAQIDELGQKPEEEVLMEVRSPFAGEIVERMAVRGARVDVGDPLFTLVDTSTVWAMLQVPEPMLARVQAGQTVELRVDSMRGQVFTGRVTWIDPAVDARTRMGRVRAEFANPAGRLKDKMFATARILTREVEDALLLPAPAIQHVGGRPLVFVKLADDLFEARSVRLGASAPAGCEVLAGLRPDEPVAVNHAFALKSAMLMSRLGAGCADD